ncbi:hypothetical protein [Microvirga massiliensis]|uniref:hypothetical protein n=1 Tax=Microvirga massiliensis TaxID=1033741 RepID=UPI000AE4B662|nr:hypothetical protein [Microvirga massiliensis]
MEEFLGRALLLSKGDPTILVTRPMLVAFLVLLALVLMPSFSKTREVAFQEEA